MMTALFTPKTFTYPLKHRIIITTGVLFLIAGLLALPALIPELGRMAKDPYDRGTLVFISVLIIILLGVTIVNEWTRSITVHHDRIDCIFCYQRITLYRHNVRGWRALTSRWDEDRIEIELAKPLYALVWRWSLPIKTLDLMNARSAVQEWLAALPDLAPAETAAHEASVNVQPFLGRRENRLRNYKILKKLTFWLSAGIFLVLYIPFQIHHPATSYLRVNDFYDPSWTLFLLAAAALCLALPLWRPEIFSLFNIKRRDRIFVLAPMSIFTYLTSLVLFGAHLSGELAIDLLDLFNILINPYSIAVAIGLSGFVFVEKIRPNSVLYAVLWFPTFAIAVAPPLTTAINILADSTPAAIHRDEIVAVDFFDWTKLEDNPLNASSYNVLLKNPQENPRKIRSVNIAPALARALKPGDTICVYLYDGFFGVPWHRAGQCPAGS